MRFNHEPLQYRIFDSKTQMPLLADDKKDKKSPAATPKKDVSKDDDDGDDLKNVDKSKGGYGHGSGFDQE